MLVKADCEALILSEADRLSLAEICRDASVLCLIEFETLSDTTKLMLVETDNDSSVLFLIESETLLRSVAPLMFPLSVPSSLGTFRVKTAISLLELFSQPNGLSS